MTSLKHFSDSLAGKSKVAGCVLLQQEDGQLLINLCVVQKKGTSLVAIERRNKLSLSEAKKIIGDLPLIISFAGESMIHKKIRKTKEDHWAVLLPQLIPKMKPENFFIQYSAIDEQSGYISFVRKQVVESVVKQLLDAGFILYDLIVGPFAVQSLIGLVQKSTSKIQTDFFEIEISDGKLSDIRFALGGKVTPIPIGDNVVESDILIQYASCIAFFTGSDMGIERSEFTLIDSSRRKLDERSKLRLAAICCSLILALFFLISTLALWFVTERLSGTQQSFSLESKQSQSGEQIVAQYSTIKNEVEDLGLAFRHHLAFYADRIAAARPRNIILSKLEIFPIIEQSKQKSVTKFDMNMISVSGSCISDESLVEYINLLNKEHWIIAIQNQLYHRKEPKKPALFSFDILVKPQ